VEHNGPLKEEEVKVFVQRKIKMLSYKISLYNKKNKNYTLIAFNLFKKEFYENAYEKLFESG
jgi:hypothetical protein